MKPFRATFTPTKRKENMGGKWVDIPDTDKARTVLILAVFADYENMPVAVFIDNDNSLNSDIINRFTNCQSTEWRD